MPTKTNMPLPVDLEKDKTYGWCSCGLSQNMPLCDGSHKTGDSTDKGPVPFTVGETKRMFLCACTKTEEPPFCDGSHCNEE